MGGVCLQRGSSTSPSLEGKDYGYGGSSTPRPHSLVPPARAQVTPLATLTRKGRNVTNATQPGHSRCAAISSREVAVRDTASVAKHRGYVVTDKGRAALADCQTCRCVPTLEGLLYVCKQCDTVLWRYEPNHGSGAGSREGGR